LRIDILTLFPRMFAGPFDESIVKRARESGALDLRLTDIRDFATDRHRTVDDTPYGGGPGMVMKVEPFARAVEALTAEGGAPKAVVLLSPQGPTFTQAHARRLADLGHVALLCGRYEGFDERVRDVVATEELSIGDYVLSGGELAALVVVDAVSRWVPGVVGDGASVEGDSFSRGLLDFPHYTRPVEYDGHQVPAVLLSGHHADVARWRKREALARTMARRPDLLQGATLDADERAWLAEWGWPGRTEDVREP
jgi:tRNA (guanine37-N1)-methyltransferase